MLTQHDAVLRSVTLLVGENGTAKSTLLEALAIATELPAAGSRDRPADDPSLSSLRQLALLALIEDAVAAGAQFVIASHAPIVTVLRSFLEAPEAHLRHL